MKPFKGDIREGNLMNRSERLNDMMRYLNDKNSLKLKDITTKYSISKSTALRDIQSLEEIGMPIYSRFDRNQRWHYFTRNRHHYKSGIHCM